MQLLIFENAFGIGHHIAVHIICHFKAVVHFKTVVCVIFKYGFGSVADNVACGVIIKRFCGNYRAVVVFNGFFNNSAKVVISITQSGIICKYFFFDRLFLMSLDNTKYI